MEERVALNREEQRRVIILSQIEKGVMTSKLATEQIWVSLRHVRRLIAAYRKVVTGRSDHPGTAAAGSGTPGRGCWYRRFRSNRSHQKGIPPIGGIPLASN